MTPRKQPYVAYIATSYLEYLATVPGGILKTVPLNAYEYVLHVLSIGHDITCKMLCIIYLRYFWLDFCWLNVAF